MGLRIDSRNRVCNWVAELSRLTGRYDNLMPSWFLATIARLMFQTQVGKALPDIDCGTMTFLKQTFFKQDIFYNNIPYRNILHVTKILYRTLGLYSIKMYTGHCLYGNKIYIYEQYFEREKNFLVTNLYKHIFYISNLKQVEKFLFYNHNFIYF